MVGTREQDQKGSKWSKIINQMKEDSDDDEEDGSESNDEEEGNNPTVEDGIFSKSGKDDGVSGASMSINASNTAMSDTVNMSLQWVDRICGITPTTKKGQNIYMACMLLIPLIPIFALITQNVILLNDIIIRKADLLDIDRSVENSDEAARLVSNLQQERSETLLTLFVSNNIETRLLTGLDLNQRFLQTDLALENVSNWRSPVGEDMFRSKLRFQIRLDDFRKLVVNNNDTEVVDLVGEDAMNFYNYATKVLLDDLSNLIRSSNGSSTWRFLITYKNVLRQAVKTHAGKLGKTDIL